MREEFKILSPEEAKEREMALAYAKQIEREVQDKAREKLKVAVAEDLQKIKAWGEEALRNISKGETESYEYIDLTRRFKDYPMARELKDDEESLKITMEVKDYANSVEKRIKQAVAEHTAREKDYQQASQVIEEAEKEKAIEKVITTPELHKKFVEKREVDLEALNRELDELNEETTEE